MNDLTKPTPAQVIHSDVAALQAEVERKSDAIQRLWKERDELRSEVERLNKALQWEQNRAERIGTHGWGCWSWGPQHYECALRKIRALQDDGK